MSQSSLIEWFERFLFGGTCTDPPPRALYKLLARLEADGHSVRDIIRQGGITEFRYQILGDLEVFLDYLEDPDKNPVFRTRVMTSFFHHYSALLARQRNTSPLPTEDDKTTLGNILSTSSGPFHYISASFWGELARQWLSHRRPIPQDIMPLPPPSTRDIRRTACLYEVTCLERGERLDPLSLHMIPASEYVNAAHWQSDTLLETFMKHRPKHPLTQSIQKLLLKSLHQFLDGTYPSSVHTKDSNIDGFLQNVAVVHASVPEVTILSSPPRVVDVFQRLLALANEDGLWQQPCSKPPEMVENPVTDAFHLTEQLLLAERRNQLLLKHIPCD